MSDTPPRPRWNHQCVKEQAARECVADVREWAGLYSAVPKDASDKEFLALLTIAMIESPDAYHACRYLEDFAEWPVNVELMKVMSVAYNRLPFIATQFVLVWVVEHGIRFPAARHDSVRCRIGDVEVGGTIEEIVGREARGLLLPNGDTRLLPINAEEVIRVLPKRTN